MKTHWIDVTQEAIGHFGSILWVFVEESGHTFYINIHFRSPEISIDRE